MANRFFEYDGKKIYYKNKQDAIARIRKFGFSVRQSGEIFNKLNTKTFEVFILSDDGEVLKINLADPFKEVLRTKFDVQRIPNKKMLHADEDEIKDFRVMQHIPGKETITVIVKFYCIIDFGSDLFIDKLKFLTEESIRKILNTDTRDYRRLYNILFDNQVLFKGRGGEEDFNPDIDGHRILMRGDLARFVYKMIKEKKIEILDIDKREREEYENAIGDRDGIEDDDGNKKYMRTYETVVTARAERIEEIAVSRFFQWLNGFPTDATAQLWWFKEVSRYDETFIKLSDFYMGEKEYNLTQWSNINYLGDRLKNDDSCVVKFISSKYKNLYWDIKKLENPKHGNKISLKNFDIFCKGNDIYYSLKDIGGKTISEYTDGLSKFNKNQIMNAIYYNKHIYPFSGGNLIKAAVEPRENIRVKNCGDKFIEFYNMGIIPRGVKIMREINLLKY
jgi:predicted transcriptional regulator